MIELDNTMLLFIGSENYSGRKIPWAEMSVRVRFPPEAQKNINIQKKMRFGRYNIEKEDVDQYGWFYVLPSIEVQHKYWYLWRITFSWLKLSCTICIIKDGWDAK